VPASQGGDMAGGFVGDGSAMQPQQVPSDPLALLAGTAPVQMRMCARGPMTMHTHMCVAFAWCTNEPAGKERSFVGKSQRALLSMRGTSLT
jgi:hypothetical protein